MLLPKESGLLSAVRWHSPNIASLGKKKEQNNCIIILQPEKRIFILEKKKKKKKTRDQCVDGCMPSQLFSCGGLIF
jgi:hypothetical protein